MQGLKGIYTALITPFDENGDIDEEGFRKNIQYQIENHIDGLVVLGTTGESPTLSERERQNLIEISRDETKSKVPLIVGTGSYSTKQSIENTKTAQKLGADAALVITPYYNRPTQEGLYHHFVEISKATTLPVIIYNHPGRCGNSMDISTIKRLAEIPSIVGIKEVTSSIDRINDLTLALGNNFPHFSILSGDDSGTFTQMVNGFAGVISVAGNIIPQKMKILVDACLSNNFTKAREHHLELLPLFNALCLESNPIPIKAAMKLCGFASGSCRQPLCDLQPKNQLILEEILNQMNLFSQNFAGVHG